MYDQDKYGSPLRLSGACDLQAERQGKVMVRLYIADETPRVLCKSVGATCSGAVEHIVWSVLPTENNATGICFEMGHYYYDLSDAQLAHLRYVLDDNPIDVPAQDDLDVFDETNEYVIMRVPFDSEAVNRDEGYADGGVVMVGFGDYDSAHDCIVSIDNLDLRCKYILV